MHETKVKNEEPKRLRRVAEHEERTQVKEAAGVCLAMTRWRWLGSVSRHRSDDFWRVLEGQEKSRGWV